ncbi:MAG: alpha/beta hydrolase [Patescibacteria group bacterium]|nr:alpha/beta hydrolase [Patescibacteria group bacterium]
MRSKITSVLTAAVLAASVALAFNAKADTNMQYVARLRPGVNVKMECAVLENQAISAGPTVLCISGLAHNGETFRQLAEDLMAKGAKRAILFELPGREGSGLPFGRNDAPEFGDLTVEDYANAVIDCLTQCEEQGTPVSVIVAHSMGGLIVQVAQEKLLSSGSSLHCAYGVNEAVLLSSAPPAGVVNPVFEAGAGTQLVNAFATDVPGLGHIVYVPSSYIPLLFMSYPLYQPVADAVSQDQLDALAPYEESYAASIETAGPSSERPTVRAGAFSSANGTALQVIVGSEDVFNTASVQQSLSDYLTGASQPITVISDGSPVHDQYWTEPDQVAAAIDLN